MPLDPAEQAQLDQLNAKAQELVKTEPRTLKEILHEIVATIGRQHLHESVDALPDAPSNTVPVPPEGE